MALVREGLGVFRHLWIDLSCCFYGSRACACEGGGVLLYFWFFPPFEGSTVLRRFRRRPFLALVGMENVDIPWGLLSLMGLVFAALLEWFLILHMRGWRDGVVTHCLWLLKGGRRCWSELFLFAFGSRESRVEGALVREGLGVFRHLWIDPSCCFYGSRACACESGGVFKESGVYGVLQITSRE
ncbi:MULTISPECIES: hypothetical protein [unclassified Bartonella]|uniref:hypothetical protein n=1 Tax=unclassified Bartonella TaxID=2645622 RepID=UPI0035D03FA5